MKIALEVQFSIARLALLQETFQLVEKLCESITGIKYPIDIDERNRAYQQKRQKQTEQNVAAEMQKPTQQKQPSRQKPNAKQREAHQRLFSKKSD